jgi:hypothetical protein
MKLLSEGKVKLYLCLIIKALYHEDVWGRGGKVPTFLTSALDEGKWSVSRRGRFTPQGKSHQYLLDRGLGGPQSPSGRYEALHQNAILSNPVLLS